MRTRYAAALALLMATGSRAQFITITNSQGQAVNGQVVTVSGQADATLLSLNLMATLNGPAAADVNVRRYEMGVLSGTENYFCWGICYEAVPAGMLPIWIGGPEALLNMTPGATVDNFHAYHVPLGHAGLSTYRYVWYNTASPGDTAYVDVRFDAAAVGIAEIGAQRARIEAYPNPAIGQDIRLEVGLDGKGLPAQVVVHDMLGAVAARYAVAGVQARLTLPASSWAPGVYFVSLERGGTLMATRRVVVGR